MDFLWLIPLVAVLILAGVLGLPWARNTRRKRLASAPFPRAWEEFLRRNISLYRHLPGSLRDQLHRDILIFLDEKRFEGCGGLAINDEIRVSIAAEACLLLLNRPTRFYPRLRSILVYPDAYLAEHHTPVGRGGYLAGERVLLGQSWRGGPLVLAWRHAIEDASEPHDGHNVVLHEFAHQLDEEDGCADGVPLLDNPKRYAAWARVFVKEYESLCEDVRLHRRNVLDAYGATNPAEFFAVATETFFERPRHLKREEPDLYEVLKDFYRVDPAEWTETIARKESAQ